MKKHYNYLDIDLDSSKIYRRLSAMQGDIKSRYILVNLYSNNLAYDLTNCNVKIYGIKKDTTVFFNNAVIIDALKGQFEIELTNQALAVSGELKIQILILGATGEKLTSSAFFINVCESIVDENAIESTNEFNALTEGLAGLVEYDIYKQNVSAHEEKLTQHDAQFQTNAKEKNFQTKNKKSLCSIIFDDGWIWDYTMVLPYFKSIGIVGNTAMFSNALNGTNYLTSSQLKALENEGWSILSHTAGHIDCGSSAEGTMRADFEKSIKDIKAVGVKKCDYLVYPFNHYSITALSVVRDYFKGAFAKSRPLNDAENEFNTTPLNQYAMYRIHAETPLNEIKALLDKAIANNGYIVLMAHSHYYGNTTEFPDHAERFARLKENIKYLMDNGVEILGVNEAMDRIGNISTIGDKEISQRYYFQSKDGSITSSDITENIQNGMGITVNTPITLYPRNEVVTHSFMNTSNSGFPISNAGVLVTYRPTNGYSNDELSFQIWYPNEDETKYYKRIWLSSESRWFVWQEFKSENSKKKIQLNQNSLNLQHNYTMTYNVEGLLISSYISLIPSVELPDDVMIQASIAQNGVLKVKIYNLTTNNIQLPSMKYNLLIY